MTAFQPMPPLTPDQLAALEDDIRARGVLVPIVVDQHGRILDGHNRNEIAVRLGVPCPREVRTVADDDEAHDLAVTLNCARRHLTREQRREVIAAECARRPEDSDRAIARRVGCSPSTVAAVRRPEGVSNLDTPTASSPPPLTEAEAAEVTAFIREAATQAIAGLQDVIDLLLSLGASRRETLAALLEGNAAEEKRWSAFGPEVVAAMQKHIHAPIVDWLLSDEEPLEVDAPIPRDLLLIHLDQLAGRIPGWLASERVSAWFVQGGEGGAQ